MFLRTILEVEAQGSVWFKDLISLKLLQIGSCVLGLWNPI